MPSCSTANLLQLVVQHLTKRLVSALVPLLAVGEEVVCDDADDREDEDEECPEDLVNGRAAGLEELY